jgi:hypothetical protein
LIQLGGFDLQNRAPPHQFDQIALCLVLLWTGFHVCQYLFKSNRPDIPFARYDDPLVQAAVDQRRKFFEAKRDHLYQVEIFYCILLEGARSKTGVGAAIAQILHDPAGAVGELKVQFTNDSMRTLLRTHVEHDLRRLDQSVRATFANCYLLNTNYADLSFLFTILPGEKTNAHLGSTFSTRIPQDHSRELGLKECQQLTGQSQGKPDEDMARREWPSSARKREQNRSVIRSAGLPKMSAGSKLRRPKFVLKLRLFQKE